jgi:hypothetical protein
MRDTGQGQAKYRKFLAGAVGVVAEVALEVAPATAAPVVQIACGGSGFEAQGYLELVGPAGYDDWKQAAVAGVRLALAAAAAARDVRITRIAGLSTDTTPAAVGAAAALALFDALGAPPPSQLRAALDAIVVAGPQFVPRTTP